MHLHGMSHENTLYLKVSCQNSVSATKVLDMSAMPRVFILLEPDASSRGVGLCGLFSMGGRMLRLALYTWASKECYLILH